MPSICKQFQWLGFIKHASGSNTSRQRLLKLIGFNVARLVSVYKHSTAFLTIGDYFSIWYDKDLPVQLRPCRQAGRELLFHMWSGFLECFPRFRRDFSSAVSSSHSVSGLACGARNRPQSISWRLLEGVNHVRVIRTTSGLCKPEFASIYFVSALCLADLAD